MTQIFKCPITDLMAEKIDDSSYKLKNEDEYLFVRYGYTFNGLLKKEEFYRNKHILAGAILNKQLSDRDKNDVYWFSITLDTFQEKLGEIHYPKMPKTKLDNLFYTLYQMQKYDGETIKIHDIVKNPSFFYKLFFKSYDECVYYLKELNYQGLINCTINPVGIAIDFSITFSGLNYFLELSEKGNLSKQCFIAMSFNPEMKETREAIRKAIEKNGFESVIIDEQLIDSAQTINDAIIAAIKSCKFCIADFSQQKDGVYFESGFAVGLNKPVIYTCHEDWFGKSHFDTNHFPHIIYKSNEELTDALDKKIKAWIE